MKKNTDSFIRNIVRQSLNESYGLLNEDLQEVTPYDIKVTSKHGIVPIGTTVRGMTYEKCPEGGFCFNALATAKQDSKSLSAKELVNKWCQDSYMKLTMGKETKSGTNLSNITTPLFDQLDDNFMNHGIITTKLKELGDWPTFCLANSKFKKYSNGTYTLGIVGTSDGYSDYGIENDDDYDRVEDYAIIESLFENSIDVSDEYYETWKTQLEEKYKIGLDAKKAADQKKLDDAKKADQKKLDDAATNAKLGGGGESWNDLEEITKHPALGKLETIDTTLGKASVYNFNSGTLLDNFQYGIIVLSDGRIQVVKVTKKDVSTPKLAVNVDDLKTEKLLMWGVSQTDTWKYDDVVLDGTDVALTTNGAEKEFTTESYRPKGFRYNLLTEDEVKVGDKGDKGDKVKIIQQKLDVLPPLELSRAKKSKGDKVKLIQQKLEIDDDGSFGTDTETAVKAFQEKYGSQAPTQLRKDGVVDQATFDFLSTKLVGGKKVYSQGKTNYKKNEWIIVTPKKGTEGDALEYKKYFRIKSVSADQYTVVLLSGDTAGPFDVETVGGMTAKILFGRDAEGSTQKEPNISNDSGSGSGEGQSNSGTGKRNNVSGNEGTGTTVDPEKQRQRDIRNKEYCDTLRQIKQYINNNKGGDLTVNCKRTQKTINQIMMALTGETPAPAPTQDTGVNVQPVPVTDKLF